MSDIRNDLCALCLQNVYNLVTRPRIDRENSALFSVSRKMAAIRGWSNEFKDRFYDRKSISLLWNRRGRLDIYRSWKLKGKCQGMSDFKLLLANFSNWCPLAYRNLLSYLVFLIVQYRRLKGKSHRVRLLEALQTPKKKTTPGKFLNFIEAFQRKKIYLQLNFKSIQTFIVL